MGTTTDISPTHPTWVQSHEPGCRCRTAPAPEIAPVPTRGDDRSMPYCLVHKARGGHSHTRNAFGRDRGHKVVTETLAIFLVVTGSQDISGSGHGVTGIFLGAVCII